MRRRRSCGWVIVVIAALLGAFGLGAWFALRGTGEGGPLAGGGSRSTSTATTATQPPRILATFTDANLTEQLRQSMQGQGETLSVHLEPNLIVVTGKVQRFLGQEVRAELVPYVEGGRVALRMKSARVGPVRVPSDVAQVLSNHAARALTREQEKIPGLVVDEIVVKQGEMEVAGHIDKSQVAPPPPSTQR